MNALPVYDYRYIKAKIRTCGHKVYANICALNVPEDYVECDSFTVISIGSLLVYENKYYWQVYIDNGAYKIVDKRMIGYIGGNSFETGKN